MQRRDVRFASDGFSPAPPQRAKSLERLSNPQRICVSPARLVTTVDDSIREALDEGPTVWWETEETIRFELPQARILLALSESDTPGQAGLTLGVTCEGESSAKICSALARFVALRLCEAHPAYELLSGPTELHDRLVDPELSSLLAQPFALALAPVDSLVDQMLSRTVLAPPRRPLALPATRPLGLWRRLRAALALPQIAPMRHSVRALALVLFAMGLAQAPHGAAARAQTGEQTP